MALIFDTNNGFVGLLWRCFGKLEDVRFYSDLALSHEEAGQCSQINKMCAYCSLGAGFLGKTGI